MGVPLHVLLKDNQKVPIVVERIIKAIELNGLFTVGLYRKAGAAAKIKELIHRVNTGIYLLLNFFFCFLITFYPFAGSTKCCCINCL